MLFRAPKINSGMISTLAVTIYRGGGGYKVQQVGVYKVQQVRVYKVSLENGSL